MQRYSPQTRLEEIGLTGQKRISEARVLVVGAGGLGNPVATYLAGAGIGHLGIVDGDVVERSNLHRQFMFSDEEVGLPKAVVLSGKLRKLNPEILVETHSFFLDAENAENLIGKYDLVCDGTDNPESRILVDETCAKLGKPLVHAAVRNWEGYITVLNHHRKLRLKDIFSYSQLREGAENSCAIAGIANVACGIAGSIQAAEALKIILGQEVLDGEILCFDSLNHSYRKFKLLKGLNE